MALNLSKIELTGMEASSMIMYIIATPHILSSEANLWRKNRNVQR